MPLPEVQHGAYLLEALFEAGPVRPAAMGGEEPLSWQDVWAYMSATQAISEPWEARALVDMSGAYCTGRQEGGDPLSVSPIERGEAS